MRGGLLPPAERLEALRRLLAWGRHRAGRVAVLFAGVLLPLWLFGGLGSEIREKEGFSWDAPILQAVHGHASPRWDVAALAASQLGMSGVLVMDVATVVVLLVRRRVRSALYFGAAVGGATALCVLAKHFYGRVRPALWTSLAPEKTFSFPSGHAMGSMALGMALFIIARSRRARLPTLFAVLLFVGAVGLSRVYLGVHFPSDVLAGWAASVMWTLGLSLVFFPHGVPEPGGAPDAS